MGVNIFCRRRCCLPRMTRRANHMLFVWPSPERALWLDMVCVRAHHLSSEIVCLKYAELYVFRSFRRGACRALPGIYNCGTLKDPAR